MPYTHRGTSTPMQLMAAPSPSLCIMLRRRPATCTSPFSAHCLTNATPFAGPHTKKRQRKPGHLHVTHASDGAKSTPPSSPWGIGERELRNLRRAAKLQLAITNRSPRLLLELIGDECQYYYLSKFAELNPIMLTQKAVEVFQSVMVNNNVSFVVKPNKHHGLDFGIRWVLVANDKHLPLGFGCSIYTNHFYEGSLFVRNTRSITSSLQRLGTLIQKLDEKLMLVIDTLLLKGIPEGNRNACRHCFRSLLFMSIFLILLKNTFV